MNVKRMSFVVLTVVAVLGVTALAQDGRPYIGVRLDPSDIPELLTKHLGLKPEQGIRIKNVNVDSPADKAGLERDDIIIRFQAEDVNDLDRFVKTVQSAGVGTEVTLEVIHLGQRRVLKFALGSYEKDLQWKYPPEPEAVTSWHPGKVFRVDPGGDRWMEIPFDKIPEINLDVKKFFEERYTYHHMSDGEDFTISIEGDPDDEDTRVIVRADKMEYSTMVGELDMLPEKYRKAAEEAIAGARRSSQERIRVSRYQFALPEPPRPEVYRKYFRDLSVPPVDVEEWSRKKDRVMEKLQEQMAQLQQRMAELEERHRATLEKLLEKKGTDAPDPGDADDASDSAGQDKPAV